MSLKEYLKFSLWFLFFITFTSEFVKIIFELSPNIGHQQLGWANAFFWSSLFLIEIIMAGMVICHLVTHPARRKRLAVLSISHFSVILLLPSFLMIGAGPVCFTRGPTPCRRLIPKLQKLLLS